MKIPDKAPSLEEAVSALSHLGPEQILKLITAHVEDTNQYLHWDDLKYRTPPQGIGDKNVWWLSLKAGRISSQKRINLSDENGRPFTFVLTDNIQKAIHYIDQYASGILGASSEVQLSPKTMRQYLLTSFKEEAITSSQLEGAATTREVAKEMLRTNRIPKNKSEWMILNNYSGMQLVHDQCQQDMSPELIRHIHSAMTAHTIPDEKCGVWRDDDDMINVADITGNLLYYPPHASCIPKMIEQLCAFCNDGYPDQQVFIHPVIKAMIIHFYLSFIHPFVDGNGRTARALFYWYLFKHGYWMMEYVSISRVLKKSSAQYGKSYLYVETDENDLTYFLEYHSKVLVEALKDLQQYVNVKRSELSDLERLLENAGLSLDLNTRQKAYLKFCANNPRVLVSIADYQRMYETSYETARSDLLSLTRSSLVRKVKSNKAFFFLAQENVLNRLKNLCQETSAMQ